jgi:hypothetical protein
MATSASRLCFACSIDSGDELFDDSFELSGGFFVI